MISKSIGGRKTISVEGTPKLTPQQEIKEKLRQTRISYNQAKKLISDIEKDNAKFVTIRDTLTDKQNGVEANKQWVQKQRDDIAEILKDSQDKLTALTATAGSVSTSVTDINEKYVTFTGLSTQVFDKDNGLEAILKAAKKLQKANTTLSEKIATNANIASGKLEEITTSANNVQTAYDDFIKKKELIDNDEEGFEAQLRKATEYATSAQDAKTKSESALVSITKFKDQSDELVEAIKKTKGVVDGYQKESNTLTADLRNTLNKATQFTLSQALQKRTRGFNWQMVFWGVLQIVAICALTYAVYVIFEILFVGSGDGKTKGLITNGTSELSEGQILVSVISKFLFTTPLIFAVYFTTSNFRHARDKRDRYAWKETVAKNFQNYIKLVKDEFQDKKYEEERFKFSMETIRSIYDEPNPMPKKRKYNFGFYNKTVQVDIEEEDLQKLKAALSSDIVNTLSHQENSNEAQPEDSTKPEQVKEDSAETLTEKVPRGDTKPTTVIKKSTPAADTTTAEK